MGKDAIMRLDRRSRAGNPAQTDQPVSTMSPSSSIRGKSRSFLRLSRNLDVQCLDLAEEGALVNAEGLRRFDAVPLMLAQHVHDEDRFQVFHAPGLVVRGGA